jgi:hypothetical protein
MPIPWLNTTERPCDFLGPLRVCTGAVIRHHACSSGSRSLTLPADIR